MKCHWRKFIRYDCELKLKRTTINNQFVTLSFRSSQYVSCEVSLKKIDNKKMTSNRSQKYPAKTHDRKDTSTKKKQLFRRLLLVCSHNILTHLGVFKTQKNTVTYVAFSLRKCFRLQALSTSHCRQERFYRLKKSRFYFIVESKQP